MSHMFQGCSSLKELNVSNFNTNNVTDMSGMFYKCKSLMQLNLSNFKNKNATNMNSILWRYSNKLKKKYSEKNDNIKLVCHL